MIDLKNASNEMKAAMTDFVEILLPKIFNALKEPKAVTFELAEVEAVATIISGYIELNPQFGFSWDDLLKGNVPMDLLTGGRPDDKPEAEETK